jgi:hypothetical protein
MRTFKIIFGIILILLGLLWSLQGAGLLQMKPIFCMADCEPIVGRSMVWLVIGVATSIVGLGLLVSLKRKRQP